MKKGIYAVYDTVSGEYISTMLQLFPAAPAAVRWFTDGLKTEGTIVNQHPQDFELHQLGVLSSPGEKESPWPIAPLEEIVLTGKAWLATLPPSEPQLVKEG